jgi:hypothetical protein
VLLVLAILVLIAAMTQRAAAAQLGGFVAWLWVSTMDIVVRLLGPVFGA